MDGFSGPFVMVVFSLFVVVTMLAAGITTGLIPPAGIVTALFTGGMDCGGTTLVTTMLTLFTRP